MDAYQKEMPLLRYLISSGVTRYQLKALLPKLSNNQIRFVREIACNILKGTIPLTDTDKEKLRNFVKQLRFIGQKKRRLKEIRETLSVGLLLAVINVSIMYIEEIFQNKSLWWLLLLESAKILKYSNDTWEKILNI